MPSLMSEGVVQEPQS